jgi:hypothetical protein
MTMKRLILILGCLLLPLSAHATVTCGTPATAHAVGGTSSAINTSGASLLVAVFSRHATASVAYSGYLSDSANNVWQYASRFGGSLILFVPNPNTSTTHTFTIANVNSNSVFPSLIVYACSGVTTFYPFAAQNGVVLGSASTTPQTGQVTPIESGDLIVSGCSASGSSGLTASVNSGFSTATVVVPGASWFADTAAYLFASSTRPVNPTWTMSQSKPWNCAIALFLAASATPPVVTGPQPNINTIAGTGVSTAFNTGPSGNGDGGAARSAVFNWPGDIILDAAGNVIVNDVNNNTVREINTQPTTQTLYGIRICSGCIETIAGTGVNGCSGYGGAGTSAHVGHTIGLAMDRSGNLYIADQNCYVVLKLTTSGTLSIVAGTANGTPNGCGTGQSPAFSGDGGPATSAHIYCTQGVTVDAAGNLYVSDSQNYRVRAVNMQRTTQTLLGVAVCAGCIQTVIGTGTNFVSGDGGRATLAAIGLPLITAFDPFGNFYLTDINHFVVRKVTPAGIINTFAGTQTSGHTGDGGLATAAELNGLSMVKSDSSGDIYITTNESMRVVNHSTGIITTILGNYALWSPGIGYGGDGGPALLAGIGAQSIAFLPGITTSYYVTDILNNRVREVTPTRMPR